MRRLHNQNSTNQAKFWTNQGLSCNPRAEEVRESRVDAQVFAGKWLGTISKTRDPPKGPFTVFKGEEDAFQGRTVLSPHSAM